VVERRPTAFDAIRAEPDTLELGPEGLEVDHGTQPLQALALSGQSRQPFFDVEEGRLAAPSILHRPERRNQIGPEKARLLEASAGAVIGIACESI
jgi:hypothetical protein